MLPSTHRMRRSGDFRVTVRTGTRGARPTLVVHLAGEDPTHDHAGDPAAPALVGIVVSRALGTAVTRNTVRRRLRALLARRVDRLPAGSRLVVRALPAAAAAPSRMLADDLDAALERASRRFSSAVTAGVPSRGPAAGPAERPAGAGR